MPRIKTTPKVAPIPRTNAPQTVVGAHDPSKRSVDGTQVENSPELGIGGRHAAIADLMAFHGEIRASLDRLAVIVQDASRGTRDVEPAHALVSFFEGPLLWHDEDEEVSLLRRLRACPLSPMHASVVEATQRGHEKIEALLDDVLKGLHALARDTVPSHLQRFTDSAASLRLLIEGHLVLEETNLYPAAVELLSKGELDLVAEEIRARHGQSTARSERTRRVVPL